MNSFKSSNFSVVVTPLEDDVKLNLDYFQMLFNYLKLLGFDTKLMQEKHLIKFDSETFKVPNPKAFQQVSYFLFTKLDSRKAAETFKNIWPIVDKKQEALFRKQVVVWFEQLKTVSIKYFYSFTYMNSQYSFFVVFRIRLKFSNISTSTLPFSCHHSVKNLFD